MRKMSVSGYFGPLFLSMCVAVALLIAMAPAQALHAQTAPAAGTSVVVRMMDGVNSANDPAGKQYRASVSKAVDAGNGVIIPQGAAAVVTLMNNGNGYSAQLASVTINGQPVAVASSSASVTSAAQSAATSAMSSVSSMLGGFGHHASAPSGVAAVAMGQRVVLPPGATLTFVLSQPPAPNAAASTSSAAPAAPAAQPMTASAAPAPNPAAATPQPTTASTGGPFISCSTSGGAGIDTYLTGVFQTTHPVKHLPNGGNLVDQSVLDRFYAYLTQKGYNFKPGSNYGCAVGRTQAEAEAAKHKRYYEGGGCSNCGKMVETGWKDTP